VAKLQLTLACGLYDRTIPLLLGSVVPEGIDINFLPMSPGELFRRQGRHAEFDIAEFSMSTLSHLRDEGDQRLVAIPVFPSRRFRHVDMFINANSGINSPSDLAGKKIGAMEYQQTAAVWQRGMLQDEYGVSPDKMEWYFGGYNEPEVWVDRVPITLPSNVSNQVIREDQSLDEMLDKGEIQALIGATPPDSLRRGSPNVLRLFPNYPEVEAQYFQRTGIFPIMHTLVVKREIYERHPWVAMSLYKAFLEAKTVGRRGLPGSGTLFCMLPWLAQHLDDVQELMGDDPFAYGIKANRKVLDTFYNYCLEQGMIKKAVTPEDIFAPETHDA
jgi:4,5-dihydroxyphthalate decarboxylase